MSGNATRLQAIAAVTNYKPSAPSLNFAETPTGEIFGSNVFSMTVMKDRLPKNVFKSLKKTIEHGETLDVSVADVVAAAMKDWAIAKGCVEMGSDTWLDNEVSYRAHLAICYQEAERLIHFNKRLVP